MRRPLSCALWVLTALLAVTSAANATSIYSYTGSNYTSINDLGPPGVYTTSMSISGSFTTATALAANLTDVNVFSGVTAFSFMDGRLTYTEAGPFHVPSILFRVSTDAAGAIIAWRFQIQEFSCYPCHAISMRSDFGDKAAQWVSSYSTEDSGSTLSVGSWGAVIPEPGSAALLVVALISWGARRHGRA